MPRLDSVYLLYRQSGFGLYRNPAAQPELSATVA